MQAERCGAGGGGKLLEFGLGSSVKNSRGKMKMRSSHRRARFELFYFGGCGCNLVSQHTKSITGTHTCPLMAAELLRVCPSLCEGCLVPSV